MPAITPATSSIGSNPRTRLDNMQSFKDRLASLEERAKNIENETSGMRIALGKDYKKLEMQMRQYRDGLDFEKNGSDFATISEMIINAEGPAAELNPPKAKTTCEVILPPRQTTEELLADIRKERAEKAANEEAQRKKIEEQQQAAQIAEQESHRATPSLIVDVSDASLPETEFTIPLDLAPFVAWTPTGTPGATPTNCSQCSTPEASPKNSKVEPSARPAKSSKSRCARFWAALCAAFNAFLNLFAKKDMRVIDGELQAHKGIIR